MRYDELLRELEDMDAVQSRLREILVGVAEALKGRPRPNEAHDWSDLPELAHKVATEHRHLKAWWQDHLSRVGESFDRLSVDMSEVRREAAAEGFQRGVAAMRLLIEQRGAPQLQSGSDLRDTARQLAAAEVVDPDDIL